MFSSLQLNIRARDQGSPEQVGSTVAIITILRDQASPNFIQEPYRTTVQRATPINSTVLKATAGDAVINAALTRNEYRHVYRAGAVE